MQSPCHRVNLEPRTSNLEPRTPNPEPRTPNPNLDPRTPNPEPRPSPLPLGERAKAAYNDPVILRRPRPFLLAHLLQHAGGAAAGGDGRRAPASRLGRSRCRPRPWPIAGRPSSTPRASRALRLSRASPATKPPSPPRWRVTRHASSATSCSIRRRTMPRTASWRRWSRACAGCASSPPWPGTPCTTRAWFASSEIVAAFGPAGAGASAVRDVRRGPVDVRPLRRAVGRRAAEARAAEPVRDPLRQSRSTSTRWPGGIRACLSSFRTSAPGCCARR